MHPGLNVARIKPTGGFMSRWRIKYFILGLVVSIGGFARVLDAHELYQCTSTNAGTILVSDQDEDAGQYILIIHII